MKKLFFTLTLVLSVVAVSAQNMWVGGTAGVWSNHVNGIKDSELSFKVMPEFGFILSDNIGIGIALGGAHTYGDLNFEESELSGDGAVNVYTVNPFVRYTFLKSTLGGLFFDGGVAYTYAKGCGYDYKAYAIDFGFRPGVSINLSSKFALIGKFGFLGYKHEREKEGLSSYRGNKFGLDLNMENMQLGGVFKF